MSMTTPASTTTELEDRLAIRELVGRLSLTIDAKQWDAMARLFTDTVYHDRTSLTRGEPYTAPVGQFVEGRSAGVISTSSSGPRAAGGSPA